jgi:Methyltransferase domain
LRLSMTGLRRGPHITRYAMYRRLEEVGRSFPNHRGRVLAISRSSNLCGVLGLRPDSVTEANFPEHDLRSLTFPDESFDFVLSNQVLEHIEGNWRFSPMALRLLTRRFSHIIECDGWGTFEAWLLVRDGMRWDGIPHATWHPLHRIAVRNDPEWPIVTWVIAQK